MSIYRYISNIPTRDNNTFSKKVRVGFFLDETISCISIEQKKLIQKKLLLDGNQSLRLKSDVKLY